MRSLSGAGGGASLGVDEVGQLDGGMSTGKANSLGRSLAYGTSEAGIGPRCESGTESGARIRGGRLAAWIQGNPYQNSQVEEVSSGAWKGQQGKA